MVPQLNGLILRKTGPSTVLLTSYNGKLFFNKNLYVKDNPSIWLTKELAKDDRFTNIILKETKPFDVELSKFYTTIGSNTSRFTYKNTEYVFDYKNRLSGLSVEDSKIVKEYEKKNKCVYIGGAKTRYYMRDDRVMYDDKDISASEWFGIDFNKGPKEYASIMILDKQIPLGVVMLYYLGLDGLMKLMKRDTRFYTKDVKYKLLDSEYKIPLSDGYLVIDRNDAVLSLLFAGLDSKVFKLLTRKNLNTRAGLENILNIMDLEIKYVSTIQTIETLFLDSITQDTLKEMKEPTDMHNLMVRVCELLSDDNYKNPNNISDNALVRYERIPGLVYKSLSRAVQSYHTRSTLSRASVTLDPYEVWKAIGDDSTSMLVEDVNPIASIKQRDNVTYLGEFGRSKITMTIPSRIMTPEEVGIISEATPDSGDSGISTYLTHSASIKNVRGMVETIDMSKHNISKALSTANAIHPFITNDD